ncbi:MAG: hypothetical protein QXP10_03165, partial [Sulfolobales archaeon]
MNRVITRHTKVMISTSNENDVRTVGEIVIVPDSTVIYNGVLRRLIVNERIKSVVAIPKELVMYFDN